MSRLEKISGVISGGYYRGSGIYRGYFCPGWTEFRVNNSLCHMNRRFNLANGDQVTVVGKRYVELDVLVFFNETTNIVYTAEAGSKFKMCVCAFFAFIFLCLDCVFLPLLFVNILGFIIVIFFFIIGLGFLSNIYKHYTSYNEMKQAKQMLGIKI
jgi:hypothetical protein